MVLDLNTSRWQTLMDGAYDRWRQSGEGQKQWSYNQFLANLDAKERQAVLLGNMNYQIGNGGVQQWVDNGYACNAADLLVVLSLMASPRATEWAGKLEPFVDEFVNTQAERRGFGYNYWLDDEDSNEDYDREDEKLHWHAAETLTDFYYAEPFNAEFLQEVEDFLAK